MTYGPESGRRRGRGRFTIPSNIQGLSQAASATTPLSRKKRTRKPMPRLHSQGAGDQRRAAKRELAIHTHASLGAKLRGKNTPPTRTHKLLGTRREQRDEAVPAQNERPRRTNAVFAHPNVTPQSTGDGRKKQPPKTERRRSQKSGKEDRRSPGTEIKQPLKRTAKNSIKKPTQARTPLRDC